MTGMSGGAAKVDRKHVKKENQERWNVRMCGAAKLWIRIVVALCSESTGNANLTASGLLFPCSMENAYTGSFPVTPCIDVPGSPFAFLSPTPDADWSAIAPTL